METLPIVILVVAVAAISTAATLIIEGYLRRRQAHAAAPQPQAEQQEAPPLHTLALVESVLGSMNCRVEPCDHGFNFRYQNEAFGIYARDDSAWVRIVDYTWFDAPLSAPECACMERAVLKVNGGECATAFTLIDNDEDGHPHFYAMSKCDIVLLPDMPQVGNIMAAWLDQLFDLKRNVFTEFEKEKKNLDYMKPMGAC